VRLRWASVSQVPRPRRARRRRAGVGDRPLRIPRADPRHAPSVLSASGGRVRGGRRARGCACALPGRCDGRTADHPCARRAARRAGTLLAAGTGTTARLWPRRHLDRGFRRLDEAARPVDAGELVPTRAVCHVAGGDQLEAVDPRGTPQWTLPRPRVRDPRWYPSTGYRVAYLSRADLRVVAGDGTGDHLLAAGAPSSLRPGARHISTSSRTSRLRGGWSCATDTGAACCGPPARARQSTGWPGRRIVSPCSLSLRPPCVSTPRTGS